MTSKYRLIYFNVTGLGEPIRYLFAYGNIPFEDCRLEYEEWKQYKSSAPFGQVPILEINGKAYNQTSAICRYLAKQMGLMGQTDLDCLEIDGIVDTITDYRLNYAAYFKLQTDEERDTKLKEIREIHNPYYFEKFEKIVTENGGYFVRNKLTWADIFFAALSDLWMKVLKEPIFSGYPSLQSLKTKVDAESGIRAYLSRRPETLY